MKTLPFGSPWHKVSSLGPRTSKRMGKTSPGACWDKGPRHTRHILHYCYSRGVISSLEPTW